MLNRHLGGHPLDTFQFVSVSFKYSSQFVGTDRKPHDCAYFSLSSSNVRDSSFGVLYGLHRNLARKVLISKLLIIFKNLGGTRNVQEQEIGRAVEDLAGGADDDEEGSRTV